jgi:glutamate carboxypeptidase
MMRFLALSIALLAAPIMAQQPDAALLAAAEAEAPAVTKTLEALVNIETGTGDAEGLEAMARYIEAALTPLGASFERVTPTNGIKGDILVARMQGKGQGRLLLLSHMDTVYGRGAASENPFRIEDGKAYGPGIADDKGGIAVILHSLKLLDSQDYAELTIAFNTDEETGSIGSGDIITELARGKTAVLSFEPTAPIETLIQGTSGTSTVTLHIKGRASHAGNAPELGVNALTEAAAVIARTADLDEGPGKLRFNWTVVEQPRSVRNIIPDDITLVGDLRVSSEAEFARFSETLKTRLAETSLPGAAYDLSLVLNRPPFTATPGSEALIERAIAIYQGLGQSFRVVPRIGGGTDAGFAARAEVPVIESLGLPGAGYHSSSAEYVLLNAVPRRLYLAAAMIRQLGQ